MPRGTLTTRTADHSPPAHGIRALWTRKSARVNRGQAFASETPPFAHSQSRQSRSVSAIRVTPDRWSRGTVNTASTNRRKASGAPAALRHAG